MMANETMPSLKSRPVTHHANSSIQNFGVGKPFDIYPENTGYLISPGDEVTFNIHYFPIGERVDDAYVDVGVWFYAEGEEPRFRTGGDRNFSSYRSLDGRAAQELVIPPHGQLVTQGIHVLQDPKNRWMPSRAIWNQHSYHITNINDATRAFISDSDSTTAGAVSSPPCRSRTWLGASRSTSDVGIPAGAYAFEPKFDGYHYCPLSGENVALPTPGGRPVRKWVGYLHRRRDRGSSANCSRRRNLFGPITPTSHTVRR